jgi:hypothetical protein
MVKILLPHEIAKTCFLFDALLYRAVGRIPLASDSEDEFDAPDLILTPEECRVGGLPPDPEWEESEKGEGEQLLDAAVLAPADSDERKRLYEERIKWKAVKDWRQNEWNRGFQELLKRHHNGFLMAQVEGRLRCQGQRSGLLTKEDIAAGASWQDIPWEEIPSTFWSSCEIDWEKCQAKGETAAYDSIVVDTDDLFRVFPLPAPQETDVGKIGDYFILTDDITTSSRKLGRRPFPWDEFHLELARHAVNGTLAGKQDAFMEDMKNWCQNRWGYTVGRSTVLQKIKPYWDEFVLKEGQKIK